MPLDIQDPTRLPKDFCVFFCWQDQLDKKLHRFFIRDALNAAIAKVQDELPQDADCILRLDSDTMNRAGSVDIANTILEKISSSTVVVGDVTPVLSSVTEDRLYPNPNVMVELGYAAKAIGWSRVVCVINEVFGQPEQLPFDIRHRRMTTYRCPDASKKKEATQQLEANLVAALRAIVQEIGRGEFDASLGNTVVKRERDLWLLRELMSTIHRGVLDRFIDRGQSHQLYSDYVYFFLGFDAIVRSSQFRFYDKKLEELALRLHEVWNNTSRCSGMAFFPGDRPGTYVLKDDALWNDEYQKTIDAMDEGFATLPIALNNFLAHVHALYPEIDMNQTDKIAMERNLPYITGSCFDKSAEKEGKATEQKAQE